MSFINDLWERLVTSITGEAKQVEEVLSDLEQRLLPGFALLVKQIEATIGAQGVTILEQGLSDISTVIESGGNVGDAISRLVPKVIDQINDDLRQDATNAAHGAVSIILAGLTAVPAVVDPDASPVVPASASIQANH